MPQPESWYLFLGDASMILPGVRWSRLSYRWDSLANLDPLLVSADLNYASTSWYHIACCAVYSQSYRASSNTFYNISTHQDELPPLGGEVSPTDAARF